MNLLGVVVNTITAHVATVHFVGLVLFTPPAGTTTANLTASSPAEFVAVMPYVPSHIPPNSTPLAKAAAVPGSGSRATTQPTPPAAVPMTIIAPNNQGVEAHTAFLIFKDSDLLEVSGWEVKRFETGYLGIQLNGEHLSFVTDSANQNVSSTLALGHVGGQLRPEYLPTTAYSDAAAVFSIPSGVLAACAKGTSNPGPSTRIDTELRLNNSGQLTIQAGTKTLTLNGDAFVAAANIPFAFADHQGVSHSGAPHYTVYCNMTATSGALCGAPMPSLIATSNHQILQCHDTIMAIPSGPGSGAILPAVPNDISELLDVACSNSQWP